MATERDTSSVLAKLMGIDRISRPHTSQGRRRVFSENYLRNVASVVDIKKSVLDADHVNVNVISMDVDDHVECEDTVKISEDCADDHLSLLCGNSKSSIGLDQRGHTNLYSRVGHLAGQSSSRASAVEKHELIEAHLQQSRSCHDIDTGFFSGRTDKKHKTVLGVRNKGSGLQGKRVNGLRNVGMKYTVLENLSPNEIAKQISKEVNSSVWHTFLKGSGSVGRPGNDAHEYEGSLASSACSMDSENKSKRSSKRLDSSKTQKTKKLRLDSWNTRKVSLEVRISGESITEDQGQVVGKQRSDHAFNGKDVNSCTVGNGNVYRSQVGSARFLSKPTLFPSAWVPRSKERCFSLERSWCSRPGDMKSNLWNESWEDNAGDADVSSTCELSGSRLNLRKLHLPEIKPSITNGSGKLQEVNTFDDTFSACESFSDHSVFSDAESPTYHEACEILNVTEGNILEKVPSQDISLESLCKTCYPDPPSAETEEVTPNEKLDASSKLAGEQLSVQSRKSILFHKVMPDLKDFVLRHQLKCTTSPPGSPVSSLEGPEACRRCLNFSVKSNESFPIPQCLNDGFLGLQAKLHVMDAFSIESGSEGPGMVVSSDDWDGSGSTCCYREDAQITECTTETCDFSYLVDVLIESGIMMGNVELFIGRWYSDGYMLDPALFDSLEKKYGTTTVWERSERRLLFDRINSGLMEILQPFIGTHSWRKPVAKRSISARQSQECVEEELWALLVNQEEQCKSESDKVCGTHALWFDLEGDVDVIAQEIQGLLFDKLLEEFISVEMLCR